MQKREEWIINRANEMCSIVRAKKIIEESRSKKEKSTLKEKQSFRMTEREKMIIKKANAECSVVRAREIIMKERNIGEKK